MDSHVDINKFERDTMSAAAGHTALCVFVTETRLWHASLGDTLPLSRSLPSRESVKPAWNIFAEECLASGIDTVRFIRRVFAASPLDCSPPRQASITGVPIRETFRSMGKQLAAELDIVLASQRAVVDRFVGLGAIRGDDMRSAVRRLALDPFAGLHPVVRHRLLKRGGLLSSCSPRNPDVMAAVMTYGRMPDLYDESWGPAWIDDDLRLRGPSLYNKRVQIGDLT